MKRPGGFDASRSHGDPDRQNVEAEETKSAGPLSRLIARGHLAQSPVERNVDHSETPEHTGSGIFDDSFADEQDRVAQVVPISHATSAVDVQADPAKDGVSEARLRLRQAGRDRRRRERREQRRFTEHLRARRKRWIIALGSVAGLALFVVAGVFTPLMAVSKVEIRGAQAVSTEELQQALARFNGVPLALVSDQDVHEAVADFPLVQRYSVERIPPHTLVVEIKERVAVIALERDDQFDLFDPAGVLLGRVAERPAGVPAGSPELTDTSSPAFLASAQIVRDLPDDIRQQLVSVRATKAQDVTFELSNGTEVVWGESKDTQRKAVVLRSMLTAVGAPSTIDVSAPEAPVFK